MQQNTPRPNPDIQEHILNINTWFIQHLPEILPYHTIDFNKLEKNTPLIAPIKLTETVHYMNKIKSKAAGPSGMNTILIKHTPLKTAIHVTRLLNASLSTGHFPQPLKKAKIFLLPKQGKNLTNPHSYRPISLLEPFSKLLERIIKNRLVNHIEGRQVNPNQFGFRPAKSTEDIILLSLQYLDLHIKKHKRTGSVSLDVAKAFDKVWHNGLIYKIHTQYNLPLLIKKLLSHFLTNRTFQITHKNINSYQFSSRAGVPQGSVLSPLLYTLYTNDTPQPLNQKTLLMMYADDITILTNAHTNLQLNNQIRAELTQLDNYQAHWLIETNKNKSAIVFYKQHPHTVRQHRPITINNKEIPFSQNTKILGVNFDHNLNMKKHIDYRYNIASHTLHKLKRFNNLNPALQF